MQEKLVLSKTSFHKTLRREFEMAEIAASNQQFNPEDLSHGFLFLKIIWNEREKPSDFLGWSYC